MNTNKKYSVLFHLAEGALAYAMAWLISYELTSSGPVPDKEFASHIASMVAPFATILYLLVSWPDDGVYKN